jgi:2-oxoisovalerate dehydrogenase E1 component
VGGALRLHREKAAAEAAPALAEGASTLIADEAAAPSDPEEEGAETPGGGGEGEGVAAGAAGAPSAAPPAAAAAAPPLPPAATAPKPRLGGMRPFAGVFSSVKAGLKKAATTVTRGVSGVNLEGVAGGGGGAFEGAGGARILSPVHAGSESARAAEAAGRAAAPIFAPVAAVTSLRLVDGGRYLLAGCADGRLCVITDPEAARRDMTATLQAGLFSLL